MTTDEIEKNRRLEEMLNHYGKHILRYCAIHGNTDGEIRELVSAVCDALWRSVGRLRSPVRSPQANVWFYLVMRHAVNDYFRRCRRTIHIATPQNISSPSEEDRELLLDMLQYLSEADRNLIQMHLEGYSLTEIAAHLNISYEACSKRKNRIIQKLNAIYHRYYE